MEVTEAHDASTAALAGVADGGVIAYYSMEIAVDDDIPTFSGGLGVLSGDTLRAAADLRLPFVGVTLVYHEGFFLQELDAQGTQVERAAPWSPADRLDKLAAEVTITLGGRSVVVGAWRSHLTGVTGGRVPIVYLDTRVSANDPAAQAITDRLYTGDLDVRLAQEAVLGLAGPPMLDRLGLVPSVHHMNEGHAALVPLALLSAATDDRLGQVTAADVDAVRTRCVFTTHTPVPAGHDRFPSDVVDRVLGRERREQLASLGCLEGDVLNMTLLGMSFSGFVNGVAQRHGRVSQAMFPRFRVQSVTNGVHAPTWVAPSTARLLDRHVPAWRQDNALLRYAATVPLEELRDAHAEAKQVLLDEVRRRTGRTLDPGTLTIGVARRATAYKRNDLLLSDPDALLALAEKVGPLQVLYSGKAHPLDQSGKDIIAKVTAKGRALDDAVPVVFLENYGMGLAALLCAGADVWLNTPLAPHEASGTSGMKAALNGVPSLSTLDGWWLEGHIEGVTGWSIGPDRGAQGDVGDAEDGRAETDRADAIELYRQLRDVVVPLYVDDPAGFAAVGRAALALNGSFFTTQRMVSEYARRAYGRLLPPADLG